MSLTLGSSFKFRDCQAQSQQTLGSQSKLSKVLSDPPKLSPINILVWGLSHQGERTFGIYGRNIKYSKVNQSNRDFSNASQARSQATRLNEREKILKTGSMYRGWISQKVDWLQSKGGQLKLPSKITRESFNEYFEETSAPEKLADLSKKYLSVLEEVHLGDDLLYRERGYTLHERRVYQAFSPYHIVAFYRFFSSKDQQDKETKETALCYSEQCMIEQADGKLQHFTRNLQSRETIHARIWHASPYHVGGGYRLKGPWSKQKKMRIKVNSLQPSSQEIKGDEQIFKVVDRRFERIGGVWSERIEWHITHFLGQANTQVIVSLGQCMPPWSP